MHISNMLKCVGKQTSTRELHSLGRRAEKYYESALWKKGDVVRQPKRREIKNVSIAAFSALNPIAEPQNSFFFFSESSGVGG